MTNPNEPVALRPLLICRGQFLVVTAERVTVHVLTKEGTAAFYEGLGFAERCSERQREPATAHVMRSTFGVKDAVYALPAFDAQTLLTYAEHYEGLQQDTVRSLAACILTGTSFGPNDPNPDADHGARDRIPPRPPVPSSPVGAVPELCGVP